MSPRGFEPRTYSSLSNVLMCLSARRETHALRPTSVTVGRRLSRYPDCATGPVTLKNAVLFIKFYKKRPFTGVYEETSGLCAGKGNC